MRKKIERKKGKLFKKYKINLTPVALRSWRDK